MQQNDTNIETTENPMAKIIGARMRSDRKNAGYTLYEISQMVGISQTHLTRIERGERLFDSAEKLIKWCRCVNVPIEEYLEMIGWNNPRKESMIRAAFPAIKTQEQEDAINAFAELILKKNLTPSDMMQMINSATAYAEFCDKNNSGK